MAYLGITASEGGLVPVDDDRDLEVALGASLESLPPAAPILILIHGYKFDPAHPVTNPHGSLFSFSADNSSRKIRSWPTGLGFGRTDAASGLCIGFAWPARASHLGSLLRRGRTGFAEVYDRAPAYGEKLAELVARIQAIAPGRVVDLLAHSLGARVALAALPFLDIAPGKVILLGAAEYDARALEFLEALRCPRPPHVFNVTARANDVYDAMFESFAPRRSWRDRAIGLGLGVQSPCWLDLQIDRADVAAWARQRGIPLTPWDARLCHWSFYTRRGAFDLYQAILRRRPGWDFASLRAAPCFAGQEPRWSRLRPRLGLPSGSIEIGQEPGRA